VKQEDNIEIWTERLIAEPVRDIDLRRAIKPGLGGGCVGDKSADGAGDQEPYRLAETV
jgi:hypothetical protein